MWLAATIWVQICRVPAGEYQQSHTDLNADSCPSKGAATSVMELGHSVA